MDEKDYSISKDAFDFFFKCIGYFNHYSYFTKELWRKVKGFEKEDEANIKCAFLSVWVHDTMGINTCPLGCAWSWMNCSDEAYENYIKEFEPIFDDYTDWCNSQR